jgi:hypothetical protein
MIGPYKLKELLIRSFFICGSTTNPPVIHFPDPFSQTLSHSHSISLSLSLGDAQHSAVDFSNFPLLHATQRCLIPLRCCPPSPPSSLSPLARPVRRHPLLLPPIACIKRGSILLLLSLCNFSIPFSLFLHSLFQYCVGLFLFSRFSLYRAPTGVR